MVADIVTALQRMDFSNAKPEAAAAQGRLRRKSEQDIKEKKTRQAARKEEQQQEARREERIREQARQNETARREKLKERFDTLLMEANAQSRGYLLEQFLYDFFFHEKLEPRGPFRNLGEQIDGSFVRHGRTTLLEAKWVKQPIAGAEFGAFQWKIEGKTADTRGLYISINGYSPEALKGMKSKGALKFVCIDGAHLMRALLGHEKLPEPLDKVWRYADETGEAYLPVAQLK